VRMVVESAGVSFRAGGREERIFRVAGSASVAGKALTLTLVHTHAEEPVEVEIRLLGGSAGEVRRTVLTHAELNAHNTFERPEVVTPRVEKALDAAGEALRVTLAPASVTRLDVRLA
jgi:alpha-N-arabinofuranosidase